VPEPDPGSASVFHYIGEGTILMQGYDSEVSLDCGNCGASLIVGLRPHQISEIIVKCNGCGSFNDTSTNPVAAGEVTNVNSQAGDSESWLAEKSLSHRSFRLTDIPLSGEPILTGLTVEDSTVYGPAIIAPLDGNTFDAITFRADLDAMLWEVPEGKLIIGAIGLRQCLFRRCTFDGIGIAGPPELIRTFREMVKSPSRSATTPSP